MKYAKMWLAAAVVVVFLAGAVTGRVGQRLAETPGTSSVMADKLHLSPEQRERMRSIWVDALGQSQPAPKAKFEAIELQRGMEIEEMLSIDQRQKYRGILGRYNAQMEALKRQIMAPMREAQQKTMEILSPEQRVEYEKMLRDNGADGLFTPDNVFWTAPTTQGGK